MNNQNNDMQAQAMQMLNAIGNMVHENNQMLKMLVAALQEAAGGESAQGNDGAAGVSGDDALRQEAMARLAARQ